MTILILMMAEKRFLHEVVKTTTHQRSSGMNEVLFAIEVPKTFEVGVIIGFLVGFFGGIIACTTTILD